MSGRARVWPRRRLLWTVPGIALLGACGGGSESRPTATAARASPSASRPSPTGASTPTAGSSPVVTATATPEPATAIATNTPTVEVATATPEISRSLPIGFPIDPATRTGMVGGEVGSRTISWGAGPTALEYSEVDQASSDPVRANRCGWNSRVHVEYEGLPAVDWYIPVGTPVVATMSGTATLYGITTSNPFDVYGVSREAYIGDPDRSRAPISPFPGPGGGMGILVRIESGGYRTDYGHFDLVPTMALVPGDAWLSGYSPGSDLLAAFSELRGFRDWTALARWDVRRGETIGFSGDSGYSEAPHLHYAIGIDGTQVCGTSEPGCAEPDGWLFKNI